MSTDLDLSNLTLKNALDLAILVEDEAQERYVEFVAQMEAHHTAEAAQFFRFMAHNEAKHGEELTLRRRELFGDEPAEVDRSMLWDVEAPEFDEARAFMSIQEALEVALAAEVKAYEYFDMALPQVKDPTVRELFAELREEEIEHQNLVKREMEKAGPGGDFDPDDFVDEPAAQ